MKALFTRIAESHARRLQQEATLQESAAEARKSITLAQAALTAEAEAEANEAKLEELKANVGVEVKLGELLLQKQVKVAELLREWDSNGDGDLSKGEFRQQVRKLGLNADKKAVDELFNSFELNSSGAMDVKLLKGFLDRVKAAAKVSAERVQVEAARLELASFELHRKAALTEEALLAREQAGLEEERLAQIKNKLPLSAKLGELLIEKNVKVASTIFRSWSKGGTDPHITCADFRYNVRGLGLVGTDEEINALFASMDNDGSGSINLDELKTALRSLQEAAERAKLETQEAARTAQQARKLAHTATEKLREEGIVQVETEQAEPKKKASAKVPGSKAAPGKRN